MLCYCYSICGWISWLHFTFFGTKNIMLKIKYRYKLVIFTDLKLSVLT